jgi:hypothetical protein
VTAMGPGRLPLTGRKRRDDGGAWVSVVVTAGGVAAEGGFCSVVTFMEGLLKAVEDWFLGRTNSQARPRIRPKTPQLEPFHGPETGFYIPFMCLFQGRITGAKTGPITPLVEPVETTLSAGVSGQPPSRRLTCGTYCRNKAE